MANYDLLGPASAPGAVTVRPSDDRSVGATDTFFKDCTSSVADDGTEFHAAWFNQVVAVLRALARGNGQTAGAADIVTQINSDDAILLKAVQYLIQRGQSTFAADTSGTPNTVTVALSPAPPEYKAGMVMHVKMANDCTGPAVINLNGLGNKAIVKKPGAQPLVGGEWKAGDIVEMEYDGTAWQGVGLGQRAPLTAAVDIYVNPSIGSDTAYDGSSATISGSHGPFLTLTKALAVVAQFSPGIFGATIHLSAGTFNGQFASANWAHCNVAIVGAGSSTVLTASGSAVSGVLVVVGPNNYTFSNFNIGTTATNANATCIAATAGAVINISGGVTFTGCSSSAGSSFVTANGFSRINIAGAVTIAGSVGSGGYMFYCLGAGAAVQFDGPGSVVTISTPVTCTAFVEAVGGGAAAIGATTPTTFVNPTNVTGKKYDATLNGVVAHNGWGLNAFPGSLAGTNSQGGQAGA